MKKKAMKAMQEPVMEILNPARSEELELRHINDRSMINNLVHANMALCHQIREREKRIEELRLAEQERVERKKEAWKFTGKLAAAMLFSCGCAASFAGSVVYGPWWTGIAPMVLFIGGLWNWFRWL